jgi:carbon monoxide dehydrogenase subunit G
MEFAGEIAVPAGRAAVFDRLCDARFFAACVGGVRDLAEIDAARYEAVMETTLAYLKLRFAVRVELVRLDPPSRIEARIEGTPMGIVGRLSATSVTTLEEVGAGTRVRYAVAASLTGRLGAIGRPVLNAKAREMERSFAARLAAAFAPAPAGTAP